MIDNLIIRELIKFIEDNLDQNLSQPILAEKSGYSKSHLHRAFKFEVGMSVSEYVRHRRIAASSTLLLYTEIPILDIALEFQFNSQEAFSRSFKKIYSLSPGKYRKLIPKIIIKQEDLEMENDSNVKGWILSGSHPHNYEIGRDNKIFHQGKSSGYLQSKNVTDENEFATMMQMFKSDQFKGQRVKLSSFIKTKDVVNSCGMWMRVDDSLGDVIQFDNMHDRSIKNTTEWNHYSIVLDVPENSAAIYFGVLLTGRGYVWVDEFQFSIVDSSVPTTNINLNSTMLDSPTNLSFEE